MTPTLFPVLERGGTDPQKRRKFILRQAKTGARLPHFVFLVHYENARRLHFAALNGSGLLHAFQQFVKQFFSHGANWFLKNVRHWRILSRLMPACEQEITERKIELFPWLAARITL
jgi:hypothetical protein